MKQTLGLQTQSDWQKKLLQLFNLRPGEGERTFLMFAFYTITSIGLLWLEQTTIALFLKEFNAEQLPLIYVASALMGSGLGFLYSWLQNNFPLKHVFLAIALLMSLPLILVRVSIYGGTQWEIPLLILASVFLLRLWLDAEEILNDLNSQVAANQLFNIREIKRTYPIISSGLLVGDVISGFSLPLLLYLFGIENILFLASGMILAGGLTLLYLSKRYKQSFPDTPVRELDELQPDFTSRRISGSLRKYTVPLFAFFILGEVLFLLIEFQYLGELERVYPNPDEIAGFLGLFCGILGLFELLTQWFVSSRAVERLGVFIAALFLPVSLSILGLMIILFDLTNMGGVAFDKVKILFLGIIILKFFDELLRYTLIAGIEPFLFQPIPAEIRSGIQSLVQGVAEPLSTGFTGAGILLTVQGVAWLFKGREAEALRQTQGAVFLGAIVVFSICWALSALFLRSSYVSLLVQGAEQGRLGFANVDLGSFKRAILEALEQRSLDEDKRSCIQMLEKIDPEGAGEILAPQLVNLSPPLQCQSMEVMLKFPTSQYLSAVQKLIESKPSLDVVALALRYIWLSQPELDIGTLKPYLDERVDPVVRGTAASLILSRGNQGEKNEANVTLETMLTSPRERERVIGAKALQDTESSEILQFPIGKLLQDESARVRCVLLEAIATKQLQEYYPALLNGLYYKSTRDAAKNAFVSLGDNALPLLNSLSENFRQPDFVRVQAWNTIAEIGTPQALKTLVNQLMVSWGTTRRNLLRILLRISGDAGIEAVLDVIGREGVETLVEQEILLMGQIYGAVLDFNNKQEPVIGREADLLRAALDGMQSDIIERCFLIMKLLYPASAIQAAILNLNSDSQTSIALGLEILDNTVDLPQKQILLRILEQGSLQEKLATMDETIVYKPMTPSDRLRRLLELRHFLSDWTLACCFYLAREQRWNVTREATLVCLRHPSSFVREAVLAYLKDASPRTCEELLPILQDDPNPLVAAQVEQMQKEFGT